MMMVLIRREMGNKTETTTPSLNSKESDVPPKPSTPSLSEASKAKGFSFF
jgi:hypothetical protein